MPAFLLASLWQGLTQPTAVHEQSAQTPRLSVHDDTAGKRSQREGLEVCLLCCIPCLTGGSGCIKVRGAGARPSLQSS